ncbi:DUF2513 domain-containing protein [Falsirhodobacter halotolerans]|uniref:DUF2513 domain-containing protein n=1 Tax=Falsirhodobacter halotolerans TaxID=1146892 RepID=UPI001FD55F76|nr:DUF2513 domain-containing protein [Falsirhodobacter halotolerans]MCJ8138575.1 DUF2513 domain-containing protein [Falsirhodobacter halotolerans]
MDKCPRQYLTRTIVHFVADSSESLCYPAPASVVLGEIDMACESSPTDPMLIRLLEGSGTVQRDLDFMRQILADMEASQEWLHPIGHDDNPPGGREKHDYHVLLLADEGFLQRMQPGIFRMTAKGHDFLDNTRDSGIWRASKAALSGFGSHSVTMLMNVAEGYVRQKLIENGVPLGQGWPR